MKREFSYKEPLKYGASAFIDNFWLFVEAGILLGVIGLLSVIAGFAWFGSLSNLAESLTAKSHLDTIKRLYETIRFTVPFVLFLAILIVLWWLLHAGVVRLYLHVFDNKSPRVSDIFKFDVSYLKYLIVLILYDTLVIMGLLLLIVPGIYIALNYYAAQYLVIDKNMGILESFSKSSEYTDGLKANLFLFEILLGIISFAIGMNFFTFVPLALARVFVYRRYILPKK